MKRLSTGVLAAVITVGMGLSAVAAPSPGSHGNIGPNAIAQATAAPSPAASATPATSPAPAGSMAPSPATSGSMAPSPATSGAPAATPMASPAPAAPAPAAPAAPPANFGSPPSGQYPILYNDHHVYSKPDTLKQGRVLAALIRGGTILIPLRSMFEQMGATVSYDPGSKTVDVTKPGADVKVTVGKPEVVINGETRPLDVPPEIYQGHVLVPVRVISEGMGAYVQWVPDRRIVVVRYLPPTPPPPPATPPPATPPPTPSPTPVPTPSLTAFVAGDYIISPKVYNEFSPGNTGSNTNGGFSYRIHGAVFFNLLNIPWMLEGRFTQFNYPHNQGVATDVTGVAGAIPGMQCGTGAPGSAPAGDPGCVTAIGGAFQTFVPAFTARDYDFDVKLGVKVLDPKIYLGVGYVWRSGNYGYPHLTNAGFGISKQPDLEQNGFTWYGSFWYFPNEKGVFNGCVTLGCVGQNQSVSFSYNVINYDIGGAFTFGQNVPLFIEFGFLGDSGRNHANAPSNFTHSGPYVGLGLKF